MLKRQKSLVGDIAAITRKPQYKAYDATKEAAINELVIWFSKEFAIHKHNGRILANEIVPQVIKVKRQAIHPTAPDVFLSSKDTLETVVMAAKALALEMDSKDELERILDEHQDREDNEKHDL